MNDETLRKMKRIFEKMELSLNEEKTKLINSKNKAFDFLGFTFRYDKCLYNTDKKYWNVIPSEKSQKKVREKLKEVYRRYGHLSGYELSKKLNEVTRGWMNYFKIEGVSYPKLAQKKLRYYMFQKTKRYYKRKSQRKSKLYSKGAYQILVDRYGLIEVSRY